MAPTVNYSARTAGRQDIVAALRTCSTEADVVQVLYQGLAPQYGYDVVSLQVLEREGWYHATAVDAGLLQDIRRRHLDETPWGPTYRKGEIAVHHTPGEFGLNPSRGLGARRAPETVVFVPIEHGGQVTGAVLYQTYERRDPPAEELQALAEIHRHLGVVVANAYLNELTRNQAVRLSALNAIARALASTLDEESVTAALQSAISPLLPVDVVELVVDEQDGTGRLHVLRAGARQSSTRLPAGSPRMAIARGVMTSGQPHLEVEGAGSYASGIWVPINEGGAVRAVLSIHTKPAHAYEESSLTFLTQVADEVALALRTARSYAALQAEQRRLEVVNSVGRRLASSLDRWSIMRTLREELARHLHFDSFALATIKEGSDGPTAEGYSYISGQEEEVYTVPLAAAGPSREAYETGRPVLVRRSRWAKEVEAQQPAPERLIRGEGAIHYVGRASGDSSRVVSRSLVWVPVRHGDRISALLSLQSYRADAFTDWHVQLLQDVAAHVSLALANAEHFAAAQRERRRLEALHVLELGVAGSGDEREIAEAVFKGASAYIDNANFVLAFLDAEGQLTGYASEGDATLTLDPKPPERSNYFRRVQETRQTVVESVPEEVRAAPGFGWRGVRDPEMPRHVIWVPIAQDDRVIAALSVQRIADQQFSVDDVALMESAAPVVGIALRTVRLHRANEMALAHSVRMQEVAGLAGHDLDSVVRSIAEQSLTMLTASGVACWAIDAEGRASAQACSGDQTALRVLEWAGRPADGAWTEPPRVAVSGTEGEIEWALIPLWYADVLVGALGSVHPEGALEQPGSGPAEFARHAAIAIENSRLAAETRDRIRTLEAVAAFTDIDITQPAQTRVEMARLVERALAAGRGSLWLLEERHLLRVGGEGRVGPIEPDSLLQALRRDEISERFRALLMELGGGFAAIATPILVDGRAGGIIVADGSVGSRSETRRLVSVLAGQAGVVLGRLRLVDALDRERRMMDAILRHSPVGVILEDPEGRIMFANPEAEQLYDMTAETMVGRELESILEEAATALQSDLEDELGAPRVLRLADPERVIEIRRVEIPAGPGQPPRSLTLHEDVTRERQALEAKDLMLRAIGHEVRSPAAAMRSTLAGILQWQNVMDPEQRSALLTEAYEMSDRLLSLVEGQLIIAKLETRRFEPNPASIHLLASIDHVMAVLTHRYGDRTGRVDVAIAADLPPAYCEPTHLDQVLTNLIGNALEYTTAPIHVSARALDNGWLEVTVSDEGQGLPPERVESLFRKTAPAGGNRARGGLGLGLYFSRLVVETSFGGRIWLAATGRAGTTFKFTVRSAAEVEQPQAQPAASGG